MQKKKPCRIKSLNRIISFIIITALVTGCAHVKPNIKIRTIDLIKPSTSAADRFKPFFETTETTYNEKSDTISITSILKSAKDVDNVSYDESSETDHTQLSDCIIICSFDMQNMVYTYDEYSISDALHQNSLRHIVTDAIVTPSGGLDAIIEIDGQEYRMSDYSDNPEIDECAVLTVLGIVGAIIAAYVVVSEGAEQIRMDQNLDYNQNLEVKGLGVNLGNYIYRQDERSRSGYNCADYHFGFTTFDGVGCEVAAAYNLNISMKDAEMLSSVIYAFECLYIEFAVAWGNGGSNAAQIYRYLDFKRFKYKEYFSYQSLKSDVSSKQGCHIIMAQWNSDPLKNGYHTFYIYKAVLPYYYGYNWDYKSSYVLKYSLDDFLNGSGFIVGYIIWQ